MSSVYEGKERKRSREEESSKMEETTTKAKKDDGECNVKALSGEKMTTTRTSSMEKENGEVGKVEEEEEGEKKDAGDPIDTMAENLEESLIGWDEYWPWSWSFEEEQMLRGWFWNPYWDVELMSIGGGVCAEDEDVLWEDDVWHLKDIKEIPNP